MQRDRRLATYHTASPQWPLDTVRAAEERDQEQAAKSPSITKSCPHDPGRDWNFTKEQDDRISFGTGEWSDNNGDSQEHDDGAEWIFEPWGLHEVGQPETINRTTLGAGRLDRAYLNSHFAKQKFSEWSAKALE